MTAATAQTGAAQLGPAAAFYACSSFCKCCLPLPHAPVSTLSFDSPPPTPASPSLYLIHGHLADMEARRLEASPIIISVCQACATLPTCVPNLGVSLLTLLPSLPHSVSLALSL